LVADSIVTQEAAAFLEQCVRARVPVLVVGSRASQAPAVAAALGAVDLPGPVIALEDLVDYVPERIGVVRWDPSVLARSAQELARAAAALREARIVAELSSAPALVAVIHAVAAGVEGVLAYAPVSDLDQALTGLPALAATSLVGTAPEAVAQLVANCFDLVVEVGTKDGVARVSRIAEVVAGRELEVRDIFTLRERADGGRGAELKATGIEPTRAGRALRGVARADAEAGNS
jgi:Flp pilus assembly CpaF family ATPase